MSIVTKTGDGGTTSLMYGRRVSKCHPRVEACGAVDELNAALGMARVSAGNALVQKALLLIQKDLVGLMGELATLPEDVARYLKDGFAVISSDQTQRVEKTVAELEAQDCDLHGWATPGGAASGAALDMARSICRRAERRVCALRESDQLGNAEALVYLNRVSDLLWLLARREEQP